MAKNLKFLGCGYQRETHTQRQRDLGGDGGTGIEAGVVAGI